MELTDILTLDDWEQFAGEIKKRSGLDTSLFDVKGFRVTSHKGWVNEFCPVVRSVDKGRSFICSVAHSNIATMAKQRREPVVEECDAGLLKVVAPVFVGVEFLGVVGGCGYLLDDGEIEFFLVSKTTSIAEDKLEEHANSVKRISRKEAEALAVFMAKRVQSIVNDYERKNLMLSA